MSETPGVHRDAMLTNPFGFTHNVREGDLSCDQCGARVINTVQWVERHGLWHQWLHDWLSKPRTEHEPDGL